jgi:hypothetical protein
MRRRALIAMVAYYVATGAWPLAHMASFEAVTGKKLDKWLVKMVGALAVANGFALAVGARREDPSEETIALAVCSAIAFASIDVVYVARGRIRPVYLGDAAVEVALAAAVLFGDV